MASRLPHAEPGAHLLVAASRSRLRDRFGANGARDGLSRLRGFGAPRARVEM
jgi:hypothetical protein